MVKKIIGEILKETKYLSFMVARLKAKTIVVGITNIKSGDQIGEIEWYGPWRQYCFFPDSYTLWNDQCLKDVTWVLDQLNGKESVFDDDIEQDISTAIDNSKPPTGW